MSESVSPIVTSTPTPAAPTLVASWKIHQALYRKPDGSLALATHNGDWEEVAPGEAIQHLLRAMQAGEVEIGDLNPLLA